MHRTSSQLYLETTIFRRKLIEVTTATPYYVNVMASGAGMGNISLINNVVPLIVRALDALL
jgi:hypothetical protein